jgi:hypothetical protein
MVELKLNPDRYEFTTKNVLENFTTEEIIIPVKKENLRLGFLGEKPYLKLEDAKYYFDSHVSFVYFLQKLSLNVNLISALSYPTLTVVANEILKGYSSTFNLIVDKNTNQLLTVTIGSSNLVSWKKIVQIVHEVFLPLRESTLYLTMVTGLGISIKMNDDDTNMDILRIEPQTFSSITLYRGIASETVSLRGYDETEILANLEEKLELMLSVDPGISKNYSLVRD